MENSVLIALLISVITGAASVASSVLISRSKASRIYADDLAKQLALVRSQLDDMRKRHDECLLELVRLRDQNIDLMKRVMAGGM